MRGWIARTLTLVALVTLVAPGLAGCGQGTTAAASAPPKTLAQAGGLRIVVSVSANQDIAMLSALVARAQKGLGVKDASARTFGAKSFSTTQIEVDLPGYTDQQVAASALTTQGAMRVIDTGDNGLSVGATVGAQQYPTLFTGSQIDPASVGAQADQSGQPIVTFAFKGAAASQFAQYTGSHIGSFLTITLDNRVIESATIQSQIAGLGQISGMTLIRAQTLAACLKSAPLPGPASLVSETVVSSGS